MRRLAFVAAALLAILTGLPAASADVPNQDAKAAALLAKHRAYVGWQFGDGTFKSMRVTGSITGETGKKTERIVMLWRGLLYHDTYTMLDRGDITEHVGFTGNLFWRSDLNGFTTPVYGDYAKYLASFTVLQQEGTTELPATYVGEKSVDGKAVGVVRVTLANGDPIDCYVDPVTGAFVRAVIDPDGSYETTVHILSYRDVLAGKKIVASYRLGDSKSIRSYDSFDPNVTVSDEDLHPPPATASWTFANPDPFPITLTHDRILVDATVNGEKGRFILDTGADGIVLDDAFADRIKAPALPGSGEAQMMTGVVKTRVRKLATLTLGGATLRDALVYSQDFRRYDYRGLDYAGYDGLLGYDLFAGAIVKLDVYGSKLAVLDPATDLSGVRGIPLIVDVSDGIPAIPMVLDNSIGVNAWLDTGNPGIVFVSENVAKKYHLPMYLRGCANLESLSIGPIRYEAQAACEWGFSSDRMLVGYDFLKHFDFVFDYPHGRLYLSPNKN